MEKDDYDRRFQKLVRAITEDKVIHKDWQDKAIVELSKLSAFLGPDKRRRLAIIGKRGAGKSSLINAIFKKHVVTIANTEGCIEDEDRNVRFLDCVGRGDVNESGEFTDKQVLKKNLTRLREEPLDLLLLVIAAEDLYTEDDEMTKKWTGNIRELDRELMKLEQGAVPLLIVVTKCDEYNEKMKRAYKDDDRAIQSLIKIAKDAVSQKLPHLRLLDVVATVAKGDPNPKPHWNVDKLIGAIIQATAPDIKNELCPRHS